MNFKIILVSFVVFGMTMARRRRIMQEPNPTIVIVQNIMTPDINVKDTRLDCLPCAAKPICSKCTKCKEELILPPTITELPFGLGYFPAALPLVSRCFQPDCMCTEAIIPVTNRCSCMSLANPVFPDYECLVRPIIL